MLQWLFTVFGTINKLAEATLSVAEAADAAAQSLKAAALDSIEDQSVKQKLIENDEFHRHSIKTKATLAAIEEYKKNKAAKETKAKQQQQKQQQQ